MQRAPLLWVAIAVVTGTACAPAAPIATALPVVMGVIGLVWPRTRAPATALLAAALTAAWRGPPLAIEHESRTERWTGTIVGDVRDLGDAVAFPLALDSGPTVRVALRARVEPGDRVTIRGRLTPFDEPRNPGEPSRRAIAVSEGLAGTLSSAALIARAPPDPCDSRTWAARIRAALSERLRTIVREPEATVVAGALWGERGTLPRDVRDDFQATGTVHVLVTAGLHLGVIAGLVLVVLRIGEVPRVTASVVAIACVVAYAWLSGGHLPSQRAAVMVGLALLARACGARVVSWNAIALAAIVVAAIWPASVLSVSFALSFSCVTAIVLFAKPLDRALARSPLPARVREALTLTLSTQLGVWPLSAATFGLVAPYAVLANAVVVPATALAMIGGIVSLGCAGVPYLGSLAAAITQLDVDAILWCVSIVAGLPGARVIVAPPPAAAIIAYDACAIAAAAIMTQHARAAAALLIAAGAGVLLATMRLPDGRLTITSLDVGQADAAVVRTPNGRVILIDAGGTLEHGAAPDGTSASELAGERIVLAYLRREGIGRIDLLLLTHPHGDHVGGAAPIINAMPVGMIFDSGQSYSGRAYRDAIAAAHAHGVPVVIARRGMRWISGDGVALDILAPSLPLLADTGDDVNENSIVTRLTFDVHGRVFRALFMGDAGEASEARLLATGVDLHADVLKVGHHGSRYASTPAFITGVGPRVAVISVGRHNTFGHPSPATVDTLLARRIRVERTDECGAVTLRPPNAVETQLACAPQR